MYCRTGYFNAHVIFAVFAAAIQSVKINDRGSEEIGKIEKAR